MREQVPTADRTLDSIYENMGLGSKEVAQRVDFTEKRIFRKFMKDVGQMSRYQHIRTKA
jgi:hypothetical protein